MILFDKIYVFIYWCVSKRLSPERTTIWALNYLLFPVLSGFLVFILSVLFWLLSIKIGLPIIIVIGLIASFFLSEKLIERYYTDERQKQIIKANNKPGLYRYLVFIFLIFTMLILMILFSILAGIILHKPAIW
jgi:uncharacterized protein YneF (UPF0154 family)